METVSSSLDVTVADMGAPVVSDHDSCLAPVVIAKDDQARAAVEVGAALGNLGRRWQGVEFTDEVIYHVLSPNLNRTRKAQRLADWTGARRRVSTDQRPCRMPGHECARVTRG
jgi:hypothetical protein